MKKRITKKKNRKEIYKYLSQINYTVTNVEFSSGYFIFSFSESSIAHFELKEFPLMIFGLWLNTETYTAEIFGQFKSIIDKFKPSYSDLSEENIKDFNIELKNIEDRLPYWDNQIKYAEKEELKNIIINDYNTYRYSVLNRFIEERNEKYLKYDNHEIILLNIVDMNSESFKCSPRYRVHSKFMVNNSSTDKKSYASSTQIINLEMDAFKDLCASMKSFFHRSAIFIEYGISNFDRDTFVFEPFSEAIISEEEWEHNNQESSKTREEYLTYLYDYHRNNYDLDDGKLAIIILENYIDQYTDDLKKEPFYDKLSKKILLDYSSFNINYTKSFIRGCFDRGLEYAKKRYTKIKEEYE